MRKISIDINRDNFEQSLSKLAVLAASKHVACTGTRKLFIGSLSPFTYAKNEEATLIYVDGEWIWKPLPEEPPELAIAEREVTEYLYDAVASFKGVQSVEWVVVYMVKYFKFV